MTYHHECHTEEMRTNSLSYIGAVMKKLQSCDHSLIRLSIDPPTLPTESVILCFPFAMSTDEQQPRP